MRGRRFPGLLSLCFPLLPNVLQTNFATLFASYVFLGMAVVGLLWLAGEWRRRRHSAAERRHSICCRLCHHRFRDASPDRLVRCPACQVLNERRLSLEI